MTQRMLLIARYEGIYTIVFLSLCQAQYGVVWGQSTGPPGPPEYLQVFNTSYNYVTIHWKPPSNNFIHQTSGYMVGVEKLEDSANPRRMMFSNCQSNGINVTGLEENSVYCVYVTTFNRHGRGSTSSCFVAVTGERARVEFTALNQSSTSIRLEWKPDLPDFLPKQQRGFKIDYFKVPGGDEKRSIVFLNCENSYLFSNLSVFANYCYNVVSFSNEDIDTKKENYKCVFTDEEAPLGPPLNITAQNASSTSINVTWRPIAEDLQRGIILSYRINYKKQQDPARRKRRSIPTIFATNTLTWSLEGLEKFTNYCVQIDGYNSKGYGNKSDWICVSTDESVPSVAPNITEGYNTSVSSLYIKWTPIPALRSYVHGYLLGYMINLTSTEDPQNHILIKTEINELSKDIEDLRAYTTYCVRVAGRTRIGPGNWSDCHLITTEDEEQLYPPVNVKVISRTSISTMNVTWDPPLELQGRLLGYKVEFENLLEDGTYQTREVMVCSRNTTLTGLQINTRYRVRVAAGTRKGFSPFSEFAEGETCSCPEILNIRAKSSYLDDDRESLSSIIESLVKDVCGKCRAYDKTKLISAVEDANLKFPAVMSHGFASTESKFVSVIQVPGLAVVRRKTKPDPGAMEKVMGYSVFSSWPIFAISGILTILAGLLIWILDVSTNPEEFPPKFYKGAGNGFWWAFITMTTLGYGDRTPKSDPAKAFAMIWFLVGLVVFSLFSAGLTSDLTVIVSSGGPTASGASSKGTQNIATLRGSAEKDIAVRKLMTKFNLSNEYDTIEELVKNLENGSTDAVLVDMYTPVRRKDLFNGSWFEIVEIVKNEISHGIILEGKSVALAKDFQELIRDKDVQSKFLTHSEEDEEEHAEELVEESGLVFFEPTSPFYSLTIKVCGGLLGVLMLCGCIFEAYKWKYGKKMKQCGRRHCQDEDEMRELMEEFYRDFTRVYKRLRKKAMLIIKLKKTQQESGCFSIKEHRPIKVKSNFEDAKLW